MLLLASAGVLTVGSTHAQDSYMVRVKVMNLASLQSMSETPDPFAIIVIDGQTHQTKRLDDRKSADVNWIHSVPVKASKFERSGSVPLSIALKDYDSSSRNDNLDISPIARQKVLVLGLRLNPSARVGEEGGELRDQNNRVLAAMKRTTAMLWTSGPLTSIGAGDDNRSRITYSVEVASLKKIFIAVKTDQTQDDNWSCGPNSLSRLLRSTGHSNADYTTVRNFVRKDGNMVSKFGLGSPSSALIDGFKHWKRDARLEEGSTPERVIEILMSGKPLIVLVSMRKVDKGLAGHIGVMHYLVINGYDPATDKFAYTNTNGLTGEWTREQFLDKWNWQNHFTGVVGETAQGGLEALGMRKRTLLY
jgi:hypothetical protein